jgi:hypothetical protein
MPAVITDGAPPFDPDSMQSRIPTERPRDGGWTRRCARTLFGVLRSPRQLFLRCPEPINHGAALRFLATLRLLPWMVLVIWLGSAYLMHPEREAVPSRGIHAFIDPAIIESLSVWLLVMVPVGMPVLYFVCGLVSHVAVGLTGGASRSVGASMRAVGYAMGPALLGIALLDLVIFTVGMDGTVYPWIVLVLLATFIRGAALGLAGTHQIHLLRALLVSFLPAALLLVAFMGRAILQLEPTPGLPAPPSPYVVP